MDQQRFREVLIFLKGAYNRDFSDEAVSVAWKLFEQLPDVLVQQAAVRMVEENDPYPSPARWMARVKEIQREAIEADRISKTDAHIGQLRVLPQPARRRSVARPRAGNETDVGRLAYLRDLLDRNVAEAEDCMEYIQLTLNAPHPVGHALS